MADGTQYSLTEDEIRSASDALKAQEEERRTYRQQSWDMTQPPPDQAAEAMKLGGKFGVPRQAVEADPDYWRQRDADAQRRLMESVSPKTMAWLDNEENYSVGKDDLDIWGSIEGYFGDLARDPITTGAKTGSAIGGAAKAGWLSFQSTGADADREQLEKADRYYDELDAWKAREAERVAAGKGGFMGRLGFNTVDVGTLRLQLPGDTDPMPQPTARLIDEAFKKDREWWQTALGLPGKGYRENPGEVVTAIKPLIQDKMDEAVRVSVAKNKAVDEAMPQTGDFLADSLLGGVRAITEMVPLMVSAVATRGKSIPTAVMGAQVYYNEYATGRERELGIDKATERAVLQAGVEAVSERISLGIIDNMLKDNGSLALRFGKGMILEQGQEQLATMGGRLVDWSYLEQGKTLDEFVAETPRSMLQTSITTFVASAGMQTTFLAADYATKALINDSLMMQPSKADKKIDDLLNAVSKSKLRTRTPEKAAELAGRLTEGTGAETVVVDLDGLAQSLEAAGLNIMDAMTEMGIPPDAINETAIIMGQVEVPTARLMVSEGIQTHRDKVQPHLRLKGEDLTPAQKEAIGAEATSQAQKFSEAIREDVARDADFAGQMAEVEDQVTEELRTAGFSGQNSVLRANAVLASRMAAYVAKRRGQDVRDVWADIGPKIMGSFGEAGTTDVLRQAEEAGYQGGDRGEAESWLRGLEKFGPEGMTTEARMARAAEQGWVGGVYHGTTANIASFDLSKANIESDWGAGIYLSNTPNDVASNYAGLGPDLTNKIQREAERIASETDREYDDPEVIAEARAKWVQNEGTTMPLMVRLKNPVVVGGPNETSLTYEEAYDEETDEYGEPTGTLVDFIENLRQVSDEFMDADVDAAVSLLMERAIDGGEIKISDVHELVKEGMPYAADPDTGDMANNEIVRRALERTGFDGIIDRTVDLKFGSQRRTGGKMAGMTWDTVHTIVFDPSNIRSVNAAFDPDQSDSADLLAQSIRTSTRMPIQEVGEWVRDNVNTNFQDFQNGDESAMMTWQLTDDPDSPQVLMSIRLNRKGRADVNLFLDNKMADALDNVEDVNERRMLATQMFSQAVMVMRQYASETSDLKAFNFIAAESQAEGTNARSREDLYRFMLSTLQLDGYTAYEVTGQMSVVYEDAGEKSARPLFTPGSAFVLIKDGVDPNEFARTDILRGSQRRQDAGEVVTALKAVRLTRPARGGVDGRGREAGRPDPGGAGQQADDTLAQTVLADPEVQEAMADPETDVLPLTDDMQVTELDEFLAFHGTLAKFDKFEMDKMGSGEGAQAFGPGHYFTQSRGVAEWYRKRMKSLAPGLRMGKEAFNKSNPAHFAMAEYWQFRDKELYHELFGGYKSTVSNVSHGYAIEKAIGWIQYEIDSLQDPMGRREPQDYAAPERPVIKDRQELIKFLEAGIAHLKTLDPNSTRGIPRPSKKALRGGGNIYTVAVKLPSEFTIQLDLPFGQQPAKVRAAFRAAVEQGTLGDVAKAALEKYGDATRMTVLVAALKAKDSPAMAVMRANGIRGVRYLDGLSRGKKNKAGQTYNYVVFDDADVKIIDRTGFLFQSMDGVQQERRGGYSPSTRQIVFTEARDVSTFMHETAHWFLDTLEKLAPTEAWAAADLAEIDAWYQTIRGGEQMARIRARYGVTATAGGWQVSYRGQPMERPFATEAEAMARIEWRERQEAFAETFEQYLQTGKAPVPKLVEVFRAFRDWLVQLYKGMMPRERESLNPAIREVFDRVLAVDTEVDAASAEAFRDADTMAKDMLAKGVITERQYRMVGERLNKAREEVKEEMIARALQEEMRTREAWWAKEKARVKGDLARAFDKSEVGRAFNWLAYGEWKGDVEVEQPDPASEFADEAYGALFQTGDWSDSGYMRVMPRDLFNEAKVLSMHLKFIDDYNNGRLPAGFEIEVLSDALDVRLAETGELYFGSISVTYNGAPVTLTVPYNAGKTTKFPLSVTAEEMDVWTVPVFDDTGALDPEFTEYFSAEPAAPRTKAAVGETWESAQKFMVQLGVVGLWEVDRRLPAGFAFDLAEPERGFQIEVDGSRVYSANLTASLNGEEVMFYMNEGDGSLMFESGEFGGPVLDGPRTMSREFAALVGSAGSADDSLAQTRTFNPPGHGPVAPPPDVPPVRLDLKIVKDLYGEEALRKLPAAVRRRSSTSSNVTDILATIETVRKTLSKKRKGPQTLTQFIMAKKRANQDGTKEDIPWGIKGAADELKAMGLGKLINEKSGRTLDYVREAAEEAGFIRPRDADLNREASDLDTTLNDLLEALAREAKGEAVVRIGEEGDTKEVEDARVWVTWLEQNGVDIYETDKKKLRASVEAMLSATEESLVSPDQAAELFGFTNGEELLAALAEVGNRDKFLDAQADRALANEFGDMMKDGTLIEEAREAARLSILGRQSEIELEALSRAVGQQASAKYARQMARDIIAMRTVKEIAAYERDLDNERRFAKQALTAVSKGDYAAALKAKQRQIIAAQMYSEGKKAHERIEKQRKDLLKYLTSESRRDKIANDYLERIDAVLDDFELRVSKQGPSVQKARQSAAAYVAWMTEQGREAEIAPEAMLLATQASLKTWRNLTAEEVDYLVGTIENLAHLGRTKQRLLNDKEKRQREAILDELEAALLAAPSAKTSREKSFTPTVGEGVATWLRKAHARLTRMEFQFVRLDGREGGPLHTALFQPFADAADRETLRMRDAAVKMQALYSAFTTAERNALFHRRISTPELKVPGAGLTLMDAVVIGLNWGNAGNRQALIDGYGWDPAAIEAMLNRVLTDKHWDFIEGVWGLIGSYRDDAFALEKSITGVAPKAVEGVTFTLANGRKIEGKYYPLKYDSGQARADSVKQARLDEKQMLNEMGKSFSKPMTKTGHLIERVGSGGKPVKLSIGVFHEHVASVIHDIAYRRAIIDVYKLVTSPRFANAYIQAAGREQYDTLVPWIAQIANERKDEPGGYVTDLLRGARRNFSIMAMGLKFGTAVQQATGVLQGVPLIGTRYAAQGFFKAMGGGLGSFWSAWNWVSLKSEFMRDRPMGFDRDVREVTNKLQERTPLGFVRRNAFILIGVMDTAVSTGVWIGAYDKAMDGNVPGMAKGDEEAAIAYADSIVRRSQVAGRMQDLPQMMRGTELEKLMTVVYSYFSGLYNETASEILRVRGGQINPLAFTANMTILYVVVPLIASALAGRLFAEDDDDELDEKIAKELASNAASTIPFARDVINATINPQFGYQLSPAGSIIEGGTKAASNLATGEGFSTEYATKQTFNLMGLLFGLPTGQLWITGEYVYGAATGEEDPAADPADAAREALLRDTR